MTSYRVLTIWTDGGARGNPGPAGIGARIMEDDQVLTELSQSIGEATNNQAEYQALLIALEWLTNYVDKGDLSADQFQLKLNTDSELLAYQIQGRYKVKNSELRLLYERIMQLLSRFASYTIIPVRREYNQVADRLVNQAIDAALVAK